MYIQPVTTKPTKSPVGCTENGKMGTFVPKLKRDVLSHFLNGKLIPTLLTIYRKQIFISVSTAQFSFSSVQLVVDIPFFNHPVL